MIEVSPSTLIFDFGNVVAWFDHRRALAQLTHFTRFSLEELYQKIYANPLEFQYETGAIRSDEFFREVIHRCELGVDAFVVRTAFVDIFTRNSDVCDLIPQLATQYRLVLASNTNAAHFEHFCEQFAVELRHFAYLGTSHRCGFRKPAPEFYAAIQQHCECAPAECLYIDDLPANVVAGEAFGWRGLCYSSTDRLASKLREVGIQVEPDLL